MGLHLATLFTGAAVGALVTYIAKDEHARKTAEGFIDATGQAFVALLGRITPERKAGEAHEASAQGVTETGEEAPKQAGPPSEGERAAGAEEAVH